MERRGLAWLSSPTGQLRSSLIGYLPTGEVAWFYLVLILVGDFLKVRLGKVAAVGGFFWNLIAGAVIIRLWYFCLLSVELLPRASPGCVAHPKQGQKPL